MKNFAIVILSLMLLASTLVHVADNRKFEQFKMDYDNVRTTLESVLRAQGELRIERDRLQLQLQTCQADLTKALAKKCTPIFWYRLFDKE